MKIVVGISGGIAAYKSASLVSYLSKENEVKVIMTKHATEFITPLTFETLSKQSVLTDMFKEKNPEIVEHIYYAQEYDCMVIAPATANIIGKIANGIADDMLTSTVIACNKPIFIVPSMNTVMYENKIVQKNINILKELGFYIIEPDTGLLACGVEGKGKYPEISKIIETIKNVMEG